jgi:ABC-type multidrug transport system fused ATPase/permease subunit
VTPKSGRILVDGVDTQAVRLDVLRQRAFITVSQDPLIFRDETIRFNLDPDCLASDDIVVEALSKAGLLSHFFADGAASSTVLQQKISQARALSAGQCQLFALCRALVKAKVSQCQSGARPIVILDEVKSSLDAATESEIYRIVDSKFSANGHTVVLVTHRLSGLEKYTVPGRDCILVLTDGKVKQLITDLSYGSFRRLGYTR